MSWELGKQLGKGKAGGSTPGMGLESSQERLRCWTVQSVLRQWVCWTQRGPEEIDQHRAPFPGAAGGWS